MNELMNLLTLENLLLVLPLLVIQLSLFIYCTVKILKEGVRNLNTWGWILICLLLNLVGPILFLFVGRKERY